jgi:hypothetical protein
MSKKLEDKCLGLLRKWVIENEFRSQWAPINQYSDLND